MPAKRKPKKTKPQAPPAALSAFSSRLNKREEHAARDIIKHAIQQGRDLIEARRRCGPRKFAPWIKKHLTFTRQTAYTYIGIAENEEAICQATLQITTLAAAVEYLRCQQEEHDGTQQSEGQSTGGEQSGNEAGGTTHSEGQAGAQAKGASNTSGQGGNSNEYQDDKKGCLRITGITAAEEGELSGMLSDLMTAWELYSIADAAARAIREAHARTCEKARGEVRPCK